ncbi:MAG: helix-turn-helix transcriptional regulator [Bdellovibrionaceae bacterium]|nr:helix-turn-helix transcriptional regulator [Bdellovibrionales bacterium]MCB9086643.1 helix-turn-helix transcriptional regulator [Pseudobdellovibrionaceae bacterium]
MSKQSDGQKVRSTRQLGHVIKRERNTQGFSQNDLAEKSGLRQAGVSLVESGAKGVRLETLFKLLAALDLEIVVQNRKKGQ